MTGCVSGSFCGRLYGATGCLVEYRLVNYGCGNSGACFELHEAFACINVEFVLRRYHLITLEHVSALNHSQNHVSLTALKISRFIGLLTCLCYQVRWLQRDNGVSDPNGDRLHVRKVAVRVLNEGEMQRVNALLTGGYKVDGSLSEKMISLWGCRVNVNFYVQCWYHSGSLHTNLLSQTTWLG